MKGCPTEAQARAYLAAFWHDEPVLIQPIETSTGKGVPDLYVWAPPYGWWLELKRGSRTLRPEQGRWLRRARDLGIPCGLLRVWPGYDFTLDGIVYTPASLLTRLRQGVDVK